MAGVAGVGGAVLSLPWQTIVSGQPADIAGIIRTAAPSLATVTPRPNLRFPAAAIVVTLVMDIAISLLAGGEVNTATLALRLASGLGTSVLGFVTGSAAGGLRKVTGLVSVVFGVVQAVSLVVGAIGAPTSGASLGTLIPSLVTVVAGLVLAVSTAISGLRK